MRWTVLAAFTALVATTQVVWLTYAPVTSSVHGDLGVSDGAVGDLAVLFPIVYVLVSLPAGRWLDRALRPALATGALLTATGAVIRLLEPRSYAVALAGQVVLAVAQPIVLNAITAVAVRWFPPERRVVAISVASAGQFAGILLAAGTAQPLVDAGGPPALVGAHAALAVVAAVAMLLTLRTPMLTPAATTTGRLRPDRVLWLLAVVLFLGFGLFNALATWLDTLFDRLGNPGQGGLLTGVLTASGVVGAAVVPLVVARTGRRRAAVAMIGVAVALATAGTAATSATIPAAILLGVVGFFLLAGLPVALDWASERVGDQVTAAATAFLLLAGNLGGAVLVLLAQATLDAPRATFLLLAVLAAPVAAVARLLPPRGADLARRDHIPHGDGAQ